MDRYFEGIDRADFSSLGARLIPCRFICDAMAVDLATRIWWWNFNVQHWELLLSPDEYHHDLMQWKNVVPMAVRALQEFYAAGEDEISEQAGTKASIIQTNLLTAWGGNPNLLLGMGWLYRMLTLDGRWLLTEHQFPFFDVNLHAGLLARQFRWPLPDLLRDRLRRHPITARFYVLFSDVHLWPMSKRFAAPRAAPSAETGTMRPSCMGSASAFAALLTSLKGLPQYRILSHEYGHLGSRPFECPIADWTVRLRRVQVFSLG
jgi:hypothetical protein